MHQRTLLSHTYILLNAMSSHTHTHTHITMQRDTHEFDIILFIYSIFSIREQYIYSCIYM